MVDPHWISLQFQIFFTVLVAQAGKDVSYFAVILAGFAVTGSSWFYIYFIHCSLCSILLFYFISCKLQLWHDVEHEMLIVSVSYIYGTKVRSFFSM